MLTEAEMVAMADYFEDIYTKACDNIMAEIGKNIARTQDLTPAQAKAIQRMHLHSADMNRLEGILKQTSGKSFEDIKAVYDYTVADSYEWARPFYQNRGLAKIPARFNQSLKQMLNAISQSSGKTLENLSRTTAIGVETSQGFQPLGKFYKDTINKSILSVSTGTESYQKAVRKAVQELGGSGIRVQYESGYSRRLDSAVRQNVLDGMSYIAQESARIHGEAFGADGWELSAHAPCAPDHLPYQGLQYSKAEYEDLQASLYRPIGEWNCRHVAYPIVLGVSGTANSAEELEEMKRYSNEKIEIDGHEYTRYECTQLQRKLETEMRKAQEQRILFKNAGMKDLEGEAKQRLSQLSVKYKEVSDKAGLPTRAERTRIVQNQLLYRRKKHRNAYNGPLANLEIPMEKKHVKRIAKKYGINIDGITIGIQRDEHALGKGVYGMSDYKNLLHIDLFPDAFTNEEELVRTLIHETGHLIQYKKYGEDYCAIHIGTLEDEIDAYEDFWYNIVKRRAKP